MSKKLIRLTEQDLRNIVNESVARILKEGWNDDRFEYEHFTDEGNGGAEEYGVNIAKLVNGLGNDPDSIMAVAEEAAQHMDKETVLKPFINGLMKEQLLMETNLSFVEKAKADGMKLEGKYIIMANLFEKEIKESIKERIMVIGN